MESSPGVMLAIFVTSFFSASLVYADREGEDLSPIVLATESCDTSPVVSVAAEQRGRVVTTYYDGEPRQLGTGLAAPAVVLQPISSASSGSLAPCTSTTAPPAYLPTTVYSPPPSVGVYRPIVALRPMPTGYYVGRGIIGQPKLYMPGQPIRNFIRWLSP